MISALRDKGFFYVKNFNISQERVNRQIVIGREFFEIPLEEKKTYTPNLGTLLQCQTHGQCTHHLLDEGEFNGYMPAGRRMYGLALVT